MFFKLSSEYLHSFNLINTSLEASSRFASSFIYVTDSPYERYLYHSLPKGYYLAQITELLGLHLGSSTQACGTMQKEKRVK